MGHEPDVIITEDSNSGYEFFSNVSEEQLMLDSLQKFRYSYIVKFEWTFPDSIIFLPHSYLLDSCVAFFVLRSVGKCLKRRLW